MKPCSVVGCIVLLAACGADDTELSREDLQAQVDYAESKLLEAREAALELESAIEYLAASIDELSYGGCRDGIDEAASRAYDVRSNFDDLQRALK